MNKRLIWNFELNPGVKLDFANFSQQSDEELRWEARFFWPETEIICLNELPETFLSLSNYKIKSRKDCYFLLPEVNYNLKKRRDELVYKPLLQEREHLFGYGKKIKLEECSDDQTLPGLACTVAQLMTQIKKAKVMVVDKDILICKFPSLKFELARLRMANSIYFSAAIEGRSHFLVSEVAKHLLGDAISCDYVSFLQQILSS